MNEFAYGWRYVIHKIDLMVANVRLLAPLTRRQ
jgi:hypothetical protein